MPNMWYLTHKKRKKELQPIEMLHFSQNGPNFRSEWSVHWMEELKEARLRHNPTIKYILAFRKKCIHIRLDGFSNTELFILFVLYIKTKDWEKKWLAPPPPPPPTHTHTQMWGCHICCANFTQYRFLLWQLAPDLDNMPHHRWIVLYALFLGNYSVNIQKIFKVFKVVSIDFNICLDKQHLKS